MSLKSLDEQFGFVPRHSLTVTDLALLLSQVEFDQINDRVVAFNQKFPGVALAIIFAKLPAVRKPSEYCFWLINRGNFAESEAKLGRNRTILLLFDAGRPAASIMVGYGLEHLLSESDLTKVLDLVADFLRARNFHGAALACVQAVDSILMDKIASKATGSEEPAADAGEEVSGLESASRITP